MEEVEIITSCGTDEISTSYPSEVSSPSPPISLVRIYSKTLDNYHSEKHMVHAQYNWSVSNVVMEKWGGVLSVLLIFILN